MASWRLLLAALLGAALAGADECVSGLELLKTDPGARRRVYDCSAAGFGEQTVWGWGRCGLRAAKSRSSAAQCLCRAVLTPFLHQSSEGLRHWFHISITLSKQSWRRRAGESRFVASPLRVLRLCPIVSQSSFAAHHTRCLRQTMCVLPPWRLGEPWCTR